MEYKIRGIATEIYSNRFAVGSCLNRISSIHNSIDYICLRSGED